MKLQDPDNGAADGHHGENSKLKAHVPPAVSIRTHADSESVSPTSTPQHHASQAGQRPDTAAPASADVGHKHLQEGNERAPDFANGRFEGISGQNEPCRKRGAAAWDPAPPSEGGATGGGPSGTSPKETYGSCQVQPKQRRSSFPEQSPACESSDSTQAGAVEQQTGRTHPTQTGESPVVVDGMNRCCPDQRPYGGALIQDEFSSSIGSPSCGGLAGMYHDAWILAPMVRISTLPFRLECLKYGAGEIQTITG